MQQNVPLPLLAIAIVAAILFGFVSVPFAQAWHRNHGEAEDRRELDHSLAQLKDLANDMAAGRRHDDVPYVRRLAPLPARAPWATGLAVTLGVFVLFGAGSALRRR